MKTPLSTGEFLFRHGQDESNRKVGGAKDSIAWHEVTLFNCKKGSADVMLIKEYQNHDSVSMISIIPDPLLHNSSIVG